MMEQGQDRSEFHKHLTSTRLRIKLNSKEGQVMSIVSSLNTNATVLTTIRLESSST